MKPSPAPLPPGNYPLASLASSKVSPTSISVLFCLPVPVLLPVHYHTPTIIGSVSLTGLWQGHIASNALRFLAVNAFPWRVNTVIPAYDDVLCHLSILCLGVYLGVYPDLILAPSLTPSLPTHQHRLCTIQTPLDPNALVDPPAFIRALELGWRKHIPLHLLTHSRCRIFSHSSSTPHDSLAVTEDDKIQIREVASDTSRESSMSVVEFFEAWPRLCSLIELHLLSPDKKAIADAFRTHFNTIISRTDFPGRFRLYLQYDIHIRQMYIQHSHELSPANFHRDVWNSIVDNARNAEFQAFRSSLNSPL